MAYAHILRRRRRMCAKKLKERLSLQDVDDLECFQRFRFRKQTILFLVSILERFLSPLTNRSRSLSPQCQVLCALRYFASGAHMRLIGDSMGLSQLTVSCVVIRVAKAIATLARQYIKFPSEDELATVKQQFYKIAGFPTVIGCIDGTFIRIIAPTANEPDFVNRKGFHSLNVQMVCDAQFKITNCVAKWPGSTHDSRVFRDSVLCHNFENGKYDGLLLGDSGYPCRSFLMTPFLSPNNHAEIKFNNALCRTIVKIEQTFGILKRRFNCLHDGLRVAPNNAAIITMACAVLHNIGIEMGDIIPAELDDAFNETAEYSYHGKGDGEAVRKLICNNHFY